MDEISFDATETSGTKFVIDAAYAQQRLGEFVEDEDLSRLKKRGFAVVSDEVRTLAERTSGSVVEVRDIIDVLHHDVDTAVVQIEHCNREMQDSMNSAKQAVESVNRVKTCLDLSSQTAQSISAATKQQRSLTRQIAAKIAEIQSDSQTNLDQISHLVTTGNELQTMAAQQQKLVAQYVV
ncbi:hypothetical protein JS87_24600 [Vibrio vulnificus]|nr:hypothetical protein JS87_24600 [Vibrio vulnificus]